LPRGRRHYRVTFADAIEAHETALATSGGLPGILSADNIQSALGRPYSGYFRSIEKKGAALLEATIRNHGFADGNKRTAVLLLDLFLQRSGYHLPRLEEDAVSDELEELVVGIANRRNNFDHAHQWLRRYCAPQTDNLV
jgi:death-on-curing protein